MTQAEPQGKDRAAGAGLVLIAMCLGNGLSMFNSTLVNVLLPDIATELDASATGQQWIATAYTLCYAAMLLPGGALGNRIGRRRAFLLGIVIFVVGSLGCVVAPSLAVLLGGRVVQALGCAILLPQTLSIIVNEYTDEGSRARAVGIWAGVSSLGLAAGPVVGGLLLGFIDWRWGFGISVVLGVFAWVIAFVAVQRARHGRVPGAPAIDAPGALLSVLALLALVFGLIESANLGWSSPVIAVAFIVAVLAVGGFLRLEHVLGVRGGHPIMPLGIWRSRRLVAANVAGVAYFILFYGVLYFLSLALRHEGLTPLLTGVAFLPMLLVQAILGTLSGRVVARLGALPVLLAGLGLATIGMVLLALLPTPLSLLDLGWRLAVVGGGCGFMSSPMSNLAVSSVARIHSNTASAVHVMCRQVGATLGVAVLGLIPGAAQLGPGFARAMGVIAIVLASAALAVALLGRRPRPLVPA